MPQPSDITELLLAWRGGDTGAFDELLPKVYDDLRRMARSRLRREGGPDPLDATELVHESYSRLVDARRVDWQDRGHFLAVAARAMRQVVIEEARKRNAEKRGGGVEPRTLAEGDLAVERSPEELLALEQALEELAGYRERLAQVVECRYFAGLNEEDTAKALGTSPRTVRRDWSFARSWLRRRLASSPNT